MRTREAKLSNYGLTGKEKKVILWFCSTANEEQQEFIKAILKNLETEEWESIYLNLIHGWSYEIVCGKHPTLLCKQDFYRYRIKAIYLISEKLAENNVRIVEQWFLANDIRRYLTLSCAGKELHIASSTLKEIATKAGALIMIGKLYRVDMRKLYAYIDSHSENVLTTL